MTYETISAEREGFEPPEVLPSTVFKTAAIDRSAISPFSGGKSTLFSDMKSMVSCISLSVGYIVERQWNKGMEIDDSNTGNGTLTIPLNC